ncbi:Olfactory receptor 13G1 [Fukomys damarensis]|uniref:Olfactory receptor 13G1 n=1 Tax=Fukomys damarensis TaxID=885580 RepID=A0A091DWN8_FUKDA|nr:Olfactory receptor 13G1 [Fukomys damarensis]
MGPQNKSFVSMFILQRFTDDPWLQAALFGFFFTLLVVALMGNGLIIMAIHCSPNLHTPMYFFLLNLALMDVVCTSTVLPKVLQSLVAENTISFGGCLTQMFVFSCVLGSELLLFSAMAYDRYLAICRPLHYGTLMSSRVCVALAAFVCPTFVSDVMTMVADMFLTGLNLLLTMALYSLIIASILYICTLKASVHTGLMTQLSFCSPRDSTYFCEIPHLLKLSCRPT